MKNAAEDSIRIARVYMDSLQVESRLLGAEKPSSAFEFLGETFSTPIMTAALSHIDLKGMAEVRFWQVRPCRSAWATMKR